jgi:hypothetical protein
VLEDCDTGDVVSFSMSARLALAMIAVVARCGACTIVYPSIQVGPNFRVRVEDQGHPVKGLQVEIGNSQGNGDRVVTETDQNGFALFRGVRPGSYHLGADHDAGIPDGAYLEVKLNGPTNVTVPLKWPSITPILVRSLKGTIHGPDYLAGQAQRRLSLDLLDGNSGLRLKTLQTNDKGEFNIDGATPGLYFLSLKPSGLSSGSGEQITGLIVIALDRDAPTDHLDLDLGWSSCGLSYAESSKCPKSDLNIEQLSGQVVDPSGAVIPRAKILLLDPGGTLVEQLRSDGEGKFASSRPLAGNYQLVVSSAGFTPYRRTVHAEPPPESIGRSPITVQLGVLGSCSAAMVQ